MRAHQHTAPLVVVRSQTESGHVGLRLIGELDLNTVALLQAELASSPGQTPLAVIDLSELRFLDLAGLRALLLIGQADGAAATRLAGATGIVQRLIELTRALDSESERADPTPFPGEVTARVVIEELPVDLREGGSAGANGNGDNPSNGNGAAGAPEREPDASKDALARDLSRRAEIRRA